MSGSLAELGTINLPANPSKVAGTSGKTADPVVSGKSICTDLLGITDRTAVRCRYQPYRPDCTDQFRTPKIQEDREDRMTDFSEMGYGLVLFRVVLRTESCCFDRSRRNS